MSYSGHVPGFGENEHSLANLVSALMPRALTQPLWLHVLARAEGPASPSRGRLTSPSRPRGFGWPQEALAEAGPLLLAHPGRVGLGMRRCNPPRCAPPARGHRWHCVFSPALVPGSRRLPPRPTSCPKREGIPLGPVSRCLRPPRVL